MRFNRSLRLFIVMAIGTLALGAGIRLGSGDPLRDDVSDKIAVPLSLELASGFTEPSLSGAILLSIRSLVDLHDLQVMWSPADRVVREPASIGRPEQTILAANQPADLYYLYTTTGSGPELVTVTVHGLTAEGDLVGKTETRQAVWNEAGLTLTLPPQISVDPALALSPLETPGEVEPEAGAYPENVVIYKHAPQSSSPGSPDLTITVSGRWMYKDKSLANRPLPYARVEIIDSGTYQDTILGYDYTDRNGYYNVTVASNESDGPDLYSRVYSRDDYSVWVGTDIDIGKSSAYYSNTPRRDNVTYSVLDLGSYVIGDANARMSFYIYDLISNLAYNYLLNSASWDNNYDLAVQWTPSSTEGTFYRYGKGIYLVSGDRWDSDVILHEYSHFVMHQIYTTYPSTPNCNPHYWAVSSSDGCAWSEGWANFLQSAIQNDRYYDDTEDQTLHNDLEGPTGGAYGSDVEGAVAASLWDIFDNGVENWDALADGINGTSSNGIWNKVFYPDPVDVNAFEYNWLSGSSATNWAVQNIFYHHGIGSAPPPAAPDSFEPDNNAAQAKAITPNRASQTHNFHQAGDVDWIKFTATAGWRYTIATFHLGLVSDTVLDLYGTNGATLLATNDNAGASGKASQITWTAPSNGVYYIRVRDHAGTTYGLETKFDLAVIVWPKNKPIVFLPLIRK